MVKREYIESNVREAVFRAARNHGGKKEVRAMLGDIDGYVASMVDDIVSGNYVNRIQYRKMTIVRNSGGTRNVDSPLLDTRVLQHTFNSMVEPFYFAHDTGDGLNCKKGCGITSSRRNKSVNSISPN